MFLVLLQRLLCQHSVAVAVETLENALRHLYAIDAIDEGGDITAIGRQMAGALF